MVTKHLDTAGTNDRRVELTASHLYDAECAVHNAHQSHIDEWIAAASDRLHVAIVEHLAAEAGRSTERRTHQ